MSRVGRVEGFPLAGGIHCSIVAVVGNPIPLVRHRLGVTAPPLELAALSGVGIRCSPCQHWLFWGHERWQKHRDESDNAV
jgi:hypothetical protein